MEGISITIEFKLKQYDSQPESSSQQVSHHEPPGAAELRPTDKPAGSIYQKDNDATQTGSVQTMEITSEEVPSYSYETSIAEIYQAAQRLIECHPDVVDSLRYAIQDQFPEFCLVEFGTSFTDNILGSINQLANMNVQIRNALLGIIMTHDPEPNDGGLAFKEYLRDPAGSWLR